MVYPLPYYIPIADFLKITFYCIIIPECKKIIRCHLLCLLNPDRMIINIKNKIEKYSQLFYH
jgi:hypothetical protein